MAYHRPITEEMYQKMSDLRDQGLSNSQIALELGVCYQTVRRFLGKQPDMLRVPWGNLKAHATGDSFVCEEPKKQPEPEKKKSVLKLVSTVSTFAGSEFFYKVDAERHVVHISHGIGVAFDLTKEQLDAFLSELDDISYFMKSIKFA